MLVNIKKNVTANFLFWGRNEAKPSVFSSASGSVGPIAVIIMGMLRKKVIMRHEVMKM